MPLLGVNIDHIATIREMRKVTYPSLAKAIKIVEAAGADFITAHLREDRRHIQDADLATIMQTTTTWLNLEIAINPEMIKIASDTKPKSACLVPEKRQELTTEGGLDLIANETAVANAVSSLQENAIEVSLFIDPEDAQIKLAQKLGANAIEIHTGTFANTKNAKEENFELSKIKSAVNLGRDLGLIVNLGHGLTIDNVAKLKDIAGITEYNIGHSIVAHAVFVGLAQAVQDTKEALDL